MVKEFKPEFRQGSFRQISNNQLLNYAGQFQDFNKANSSKLPTNFAWTLREQLLKELMGEWYFKTENSTLQNQENFFWFNLIQGQKIALVKIGDKLSVMGVSKYNFDMFGELTGMVTLYSLPFFGGENRSHKISFKLPADKVVVITWDIMFQGFEASFNWVWSIATNLMEFILVNYTLKNKKFILTQKSTNPFVQNALENSLQDISPIITILDPKAQGDITTRQNNTGKLSELVPIEGYGDSMNGMSIIDLVHFWNFAKDIMGMNAYSAHKAERVISAEMEGAFYNTEIIRQNHLRNLKAKENECKRKGIDISFFNFIEEKKKEQEKQIEKENEGLKNE